MVRPQISAPAFNFSMKTSRSETDMIDIMKMLYQSRWSTIMFDLIFFFADSKLSTLSQVHSEFPPLWTTVTAVPLFLLVPAVTIAGWSSLVSTSWSIMEKFHTMVRDVVISVRIGFHHPCIEQFGMRRTIAQYLLQFRDHVAVGDRMVIMILSPSAGSGSSTMINTQTSHMIGLKLTNRDASLPVCTQAAHWMVGALSGHPFLKLDVTFTNALANSYRMIRNGSILDLSNATLHSMQQGGRDLTNVTVDKINLEVTIRRVN